MRRKDRVLGVWVNLESETFENVPVSYSVATTRPLQDITEPNSYKQLSLGASNLYMQPADASDSPATIEEFTTALRERKSATGLYSENVGGVQFLSQNLFRATVRLRPTFRSAPTRLAPSCSRAACSSRKARPSSKSASPVSNSRSSASRTTIPSSTASSPYRWPC